MAPPMASPTIRTGRRMLQCQSCLALLQPAQKVLLRPVEIRLLVHFRAAFPRRHRERANMHAIGLGALQQRHMPKRWRRRLENRHQVAQHRVIGADLVRVAPAIDQVRRLIERGVDEMSCALQRRPRHAGIGPGRSDRPRRDGRRRAGAAFAATARPLRIRRRRRNAARQRFPPDPWRPRQRPSCLPFTLLRCDYRGPA